MISTSMALLMCALLAAIGLGMGVMLGQLNARRVQRKAGEALNASSAKAQLARTRAEEQQRRAEEQQRELEQLRGLLGAPDPAAAAATPRHNERFFNPLERAQDALLELAGLKYMVAYALLDESGMVLHGDERSPQVRTLAALSGVLSSRGVWTSATRVEVIDTRGQTLTLMRVPGDLPVLIAAWSSGAPVLEATLARAQLAMTGELPARGDERGATRRKNSPLRPDAAVTSGALKRLLAAVPVTSVAVLRGSEVRLQLGTREEPGTTAELVRDARKLLEARSAQGLGELDHITLSGHDRCVVARPIRSPAGVSGVLELEVAGRHSIPESTLSHVASQLAISALDPPTVPPDEARDASLATSPAATVQEVRIA